MATPLPANAAATVPEDAAFQDALPPPSPTAEPAAAAPDVDLTPVAPAGDGIASSLPPIAPVASAEVRGLSPPAEAKPKKGRGAGKRLTDRERLEILELFDKGAGVSNADIARRYGITRAAIQKLKAKGAEVKARYRYGSAGSRDERKRGSHSVSVPFEKELFEWVRGLKARKVPVPPSLVKEKAKLLVPKYNLGDFQASNGWYYNFCRRFSLSTGVLVEEKLESDVNVQKQQQQQQQQQSHQEAQASLPLSVQSQQQQLYQPHLYASAHLGMLATGSPHLDLPTEAAKSDRILDLLEKQAALIERQTRVSEEQSETMKKLLDFLVTGQHGGSSANI